MSEDLVVEARGVGRLRVRLEEGVLVKIEFGGDGGGADAGSQSGRRVVRQLREYLAGERREFEVKVGWRGTEFQQKVWGEIAKVPYGETITYKELAERVGKLRAFRAVARACRANPVPLVVPCHRIVGSSGEVGGYSGGLEKKKWLLELEKGKWAN